ncbi:MAG: copper-containing nitrite reductase [Halodesulfurarchaeum sp.]
MTGRRSLLKGIGASTLFGALSRGVSASPLGNDTTDRGGEVVDRVAADPTDVPDPINRDRPVHHDITLTAEEVVSAVEPGTTYTYMTFDGQVPGPMLRVRQGDTVEFTLENPPANNRTHNVDMHAIYGTGGGSVATTASPGTANSEQFTAMYPGAFIYHCAVPQMDAHVASGMYGLILVEPKDGLPAVDREFYVGQHEIYAGDPTYPILQTGHQVLNKRAMTREDPSYVTLNGETRALTPDRYGAMAAETGETVRVFFVNGGPNLASHFHPIGNVWRRAWRDGALRSDPAEYVQTVTVPPGSGLVAEMELPVPEQIKLVDHSLSRVVRKGMLGIVDVAGPERPTVFDPDPSQADCQMN